MKDELHGWLQPEAVEASIEFEFPQSRHFAAAEDLAFRRLRANIAERDAIRHSGDNGGNIYVPRRYAEWPAIYGGGVSDSGKRIVGGGDETKIACGFDVPRDLTLRRHEVCEGCIRVIMRRDHGRFEMLQRQLREMQFRFAGAQIRFGQASPVLLHRNFSFGAQIDHTGVSRGDANGRNGNRSGIAWAVRVVVQTCPKVLSVHVPGLGCRASVDLRAEDAVPRIEAADCEVQNLLDAGFRAG